MGEELTASEVARLFDWLKANGHDDADCVRCIDYIAGKSNNPKISKAD